MSEATGGGYTSLYIRLSLLDCVLFWWLNLQMHFANTIRWVSFQEHLELTTRSRSVSLSLQIPNLLLQPVPQATSDGDTSGSNRHQPALGCVHQQRLLLEATNNKGESLGNGEYCVL